MTDSIYKIYKKFYQRSYRNPEDEELKLISTTIHDVIKDLYNNQDNIKKYNSIKKNSLIIAEELRNKVTEACHLSVQLEFDFIDKAFEMGEVEGLNRAQLQNFIKARANEKMIELGYNAVYNDIDPNLLKLADNIHPIT